MASCIYRLHECVAERSSDGSCFEEVIQRRFQLRSSLLDGPAKFHVLREGQVRSGLCIWKHLSPEFGSLILHECNRVRPGIDHFHDVTRIQNRIGVAWYSGRFSLSLKSGIQVIKIFSHAGPGSYPDFLSAQILHRFQFRRARTRDRHNLQPRHCRNRKVYDGLVFGCDRDAVRRDIAVAAQHAVPQFIGRSRYKRHDNTIGGRRLVVLRSGPSRVPEKLPAGYRPDARRYKRIQAGGTEPDTRTTRRLTIWSRSPFHGVFRMGGRPSSICRQILVSCQPEEPLERLRRGVRFCFRRCSFGTTPEQETERRQPNDHYTMHSAIRPSRVATC